MKILIKTPGRVCVTQDHVCRDGNIYSETGTRTSSVDEETEVLDVRLPIVADNKLPNGQLRILEGHTRFYEAARRGLAIETEYDEKEEDLEGCPTECFVDDNLFNRYAAGLSRCRAMLQGIDNAQGMAIRSGFVYVGDFIWKRGGLV